MMRSIIVSAVLGLASLGLFLGPLASTADAQVFRRAYWNTVPQTYYYSYPSYYGGYYYPNYSNYGSSNYYYPGAYNYGYNSYYYPGAYNYSSYYAYPSNRQYYVYPGIIYRY